MGEIPIRRREDRDDDPRAAIEPFDAELDQTLKEIGFEHDCARWVRDAVTTAAEAGVALDPESVLVTLIYAAGQTSSLRAEVIARMRASGFIARVLELIEED